MSTQRTIDLDRSEQPRAGLALAAALAAIPGVTMAWDLPAGGFWIGCPLAVVAVVLGLRARALQAPGGRGAATAAIVIGAAALAFVATWTLAELLS